MKKIKIGIDISMLVYQGSGVATYTYEMVKSLLLADKKNQYSLFYSSLRKPQNINFIKEFKQLGAKVYNYPIPTKILNLIWNKTSLMPIEYIIGKQDFFFSSDYLRPPLLKNTTGITTIHDLTWKLYPQYHTAKIIKSHERKLRKTIKSKDIIIVDSDNTKKDLLKLYTQILNHNQVYKIYPGISKIYKKINPNQIKKTLLKYKINLSLNYLIYVGAIEPRKNIDQSIKVFKKLIDIPKYKDYRYYLVGRAGWKNKQIFQLINNLNLEDKVIFLGYVEQQDLPSFYSGAKACIYLSQYEGFGLPPLEAAQCGTPTLLYRNSSLAELFSNRYPYARKNQELGTLVHLIESNTILKKEKYNQFSWENFSQKFTKLIIKHHGE